MKPAGDMPLQRDLKHKHNAWSEPTTTTTPAGIMTTRYCTVADCLARQDVLDTPYDRKARRN
jgi:hypothetical protein